MKKVLILGGAGFIGAALVQKLNELGFDVTAVDRYWAIKPAGVRCLTGDAFDTSFLNDLMPNQDVVFHLVSTTVPASSNKSPVFDCETNVIGSLKILDAMVENNVSKIVFSSSGGTVYGIPDSVPIKENFPNFPISAYGIGKLTIERYLYLYSYLHGINASVLRFANPYGPGQVPETGQGAIATFVKRALHGETIEIWGDGSVIRDFIYIDDVVDAFIASERIREPFTLFNIGLGQGKSLLEVVATIERELSNKISVTFRSSRPFDVPEVVLDIQKAKSVLGWQPKHSFEEGMKKLVAHMKSQVGTSKNPCPQP